MLQHNLEFWIDFNLPPVMAEWLKEDFNVSAKSFKELNFETEDDTTVFKRAVNKFNIVVITTKDSDFVKLANDFLNPPKILYISVGNISNKKLKEIIYKQFKEVLKIFSESNNYLIEIGKEL